MEIIILSFGQITDITGREEFRITDVKNTKELRIKLAEFFPSIASVNYSIAVNKKVVQTNIELNSEDTVALLPPFSGG